jgi:hypothetical protein
VQPQIKEVSEVANREQRSNREKKKAKAPRQKAPAAQVSPFGRSQGAGSAKSGKKHR